MDVRARSSEQSPSNPSWAPSERIQRLAAEHGRAVPAVGVERAIHYTDFYKSEAKRHSSAQQLNAHSLAHHLRRRTIRIYDHELIVGTHTEHRIGAICHIEKAGVAMLEDLFRFEKRAVNPLAIDPKARWTLLRSVIPLLAEPQHHHAVAKLGLSRYSREGLGAIARGFEEAGIEIGNQGSHE